MLRKTRGARGERDLYYFQQGHRTEPASWGLNNEVAHETEGHHGAIQLSCAVWHLDDSRDVEVDV